MFYSTINKLVFNNGLELPIAPNDIVIFVGPNNCGKSQSLKDIHSCVSQNIDTVVVKKVGLSFGSLEELKASVSESSVVQQANNTQYSGYGYTIFQMDFNSYSNNPKLAMNLRNYLFSYLGTEQRLTISNAPNAVDSDDIKTHPIHYILYGENYRSTISRYFKEAFGYDLIPNYLSRKRVHLLMGDVPQVNDGGTVPSVMAKLEKVFQSYQKVDDQGDGMRSFTGVILHLILKNYGVFLIDEPESFLHPPQARIMGKVIGELLGSDRQAFLSTHSEDIIKGLMDVCPQRIKVIRITREGNINSFAVLNNDEFEAIWGDPLLKHSNIMSSLFHKDVVLCESDSDCRLYSIVLDHLKHEDGFYSESLFIHCGGKQRMEKVAGALKSLSIDFKCVPDLDILNDKQTIKGLFEVCGGKWDDKMDTYYDTFAKQLNGGSETVSKTIVLEKVNAFLDQLEDDHLKRKDIDNLEKELRIETKWSQLKKGGIDSIPSGQATTSFNALHSALNSVNIFPVLVGELERFIKEVGGHGPTWVNAVLEQYPDLGDKVYDRVRAFVKSWGL